MGTGFAQAPSYGTVQIVRDVTFNTAIERYPDNKGTLHIAIDLKLQPDGTLAGSGSYVWHWQWAISPNCGVPSSIWHGELSFDVTGTETEGTVSATAPGMITVSNRNLWGRAATTGKSPTTSTSSTTGTFLR